MKNILISGASAGFGYAIAKKFSKENYRVLGVARRKEKLEQLKRECGENFIPIVCDISNKDAVQNCLSALPSEISIDILVNNAGFALGMDPAQKSNLEDWESMVDTNIKGLLYLTHAILPGMVEKNKGHIINMGSVAGEFPYPNGNVYGATKAFVHQLSLNLRADLLGTDVRVSCIEPGMCSGTEFSEVRFKGDKAKAATVYQGVSAVTPEDIAETVYWIATRPKHLNINDISLMPTQQAFGPFSVSRNR